MKAAAVHPLKNNDVAAGIDDAAGDCDLGLARLIDGRGHHLLSALMGQAFCVGDVHEYSVTWRSLRQAPHGIKVARLQKQSAAPRRERRVRAYSVRPGGARLRLLHALFDKEPAVVA